MLHLAILVSHCRGRGLPIDRRPRRWRYCGDGRRWRGTTRAVRDARLVQTLIPFLMFCGEQHGKAEEPIHWYCSVFPDARVVMIDRYGPGDGEPEGTVRVAEF